MQFKNYVAVLIAFSSIAFAIPSKAAQEERFLQKPFLLRTKVVNNSSSYDYDGLYVYPHHTGAAQNAAALQKYRDDITWARMKAGKLAFELRGAKDAVYSLKFFKFDLSEGWGYMTISAAGVGHDGDFKIDSNGYLSFSSADALRKNNFPPWRVCLWNHGVPELFFNNIESDDNADTFVVPSTCELAELEVLYNAPKHHALA